LLKLLPKWVLLLGISGLILVGCQEELELGTGTVVGNEKKVVLAEETNMLTLNADEAKIYQNFKQQKNPQLLQNADPIMVAKFFMHALLQKDYQTEYSLYIDDPGQVKWNQATHLKKMVPEEQKLAKQLQKIFKGVHEVKFVEADKTSGYLEFPLEGENMGRFQMVKNQAGIWKVKFNPLQ